MQMQSLPHNLNETCRVDYECFLSGSGFISNAKHDVTATMAASGQCVQISSSPSAGLEEAASL